eukprot:740708-Pleurochrysis_carterae.AAC.2
MLTGSARRRAVRDGARRRVVRGKSAKGEATTDGLHWVLLGAHRLSLSSKTGRALRTALVFELNARRAIALGAHELDFNAAPKAL